MIDELRHTYLEKEASSEQGYSSRPLVLPVNKRKTLVRHALDGVLMTADDHMVVPVRLAETLLDPKIKNREGSIGDVVMRYQTPSGVILYFELASLEKSPFYHNLMEGVNGNKMGIYGSGRYGAGLLQKLKFWQIEHTQKDHEGKRTKVTGEYTIPNRLGIHSRPAAAFVKTASAFDSDITVLKGDKHPVSGKSIMGLLTLEASRGSKLKVEAKGPDAQAAIDAIRILIESKFGED